MRLLKETIELRADTEFEAKEIIENYRKEAAEKGYTIGAAGYTYKTKKAKGEIVEKGTHEELMENGNIYKALYTLQFRDNDKV